MEGYTNTIQQIQQLIEETGDLRSQLAIIRISEPISSAVELNSFDISPSKRRSDVSTLDNPTPAALDADLTHYKELFAKLRFSYVEQVTKERFLRAIVGDPPLVVGHNENLETEAQLAEGKAELRKRKEEVTAMIEEMEKTSRELARRYEDVELQLSQLSTLPASIEELERTIADLRTKQMANTSGSSSQNLSLAGTQSLLSEREAELAALNRQIATLESSLPRKTREAEAIERDVGMLEKRRVDAAAQAQEALRKKQEGETDGLEEMGRWYRGSEEVLKSLVGVKV